MKYLKLYEGFEDFEETWIDEEPEPDDIVSSIKYFVIYDTEKDILVIYKGKFIEYRTYFKKSSEFKFFYNENALNGTWTKDFIEKYSRQARIFFDNAFYKSKDIIVIFCNDSNLVENIRYLCDRYIGREFDAKEIEWTVQHHHDGVMEFSY